MSKMRNIFETEENRKKVEGLFVEFLNAFRSRRMEEFDKKDLSQRITLIEIFDQFDLVEALDFGERTGIIIWVAKAIKHDEEIRHFCRTFQISEGTVSFWLNAA